MKKIFITGATSMIGVALIYVALQNDYFVGCTVRPGSSRVSILPVSKRIKVYCCNLENISSLNIHEQYDIFVHLAWDKTCGLSRDDADIQLRNIQYTLDAVRLANLLGCKVFCGAGSQAEYGIVDSPLTSEMPVNPCSGYGIAKFTAGKLSAMLCTQLGIRHNWLRILSVYGPNDAPHTLISYVFKELLMGQVPALTKCEQIWDYLYSDDAATAILAVAESGKHGKVYPLGSGKGRKLCNYIEDIKNIINPEGKIGYGEIKYFPHQPMFLVADIDDLISDTGWKPVVSFNVGIRFMLRNYIVNL